MHPLSIWGGKDRRLALDREEKMEKDASNVCRCSCCLLCVC